MKFIQIFKDGKMDEITFDEKNINEKNLFKYFYKISKSQGSCNINKLYTWKYDNSEIICYGWYDGDNGFENNHDLPKSGCSKFIDEDSSIKKIYGDIFILKSNKNVYSDLSVSEYSVFYSGQVEDYSDYESDDISENNFAENEKNENENENDTDNYTNEDYEIINENKNDYLELEYDNNEY